MDKEYQNYKKNRKIPKYIPLNVGIEDSDNLKIGTSVPKVLIIIPFRDLSYTKERTKQLYKFINHYMNNDSQLRLNASIIIVEQSNDGNPFNRGALLNIGFELGKNSNPDIYIFHDVDLLSSPKIYHLYNIYPEHPIHIGALWKTKYNFYTFFGGINSFNKEDFEKINGFPNTFYGWGGEDDAIFNRIAINDIPIYKPKISNNFSESLIQDLDKNENEDSKGSNVYKKRKIIEDLKNWKYDGLNSLKFEILEVKNFKSPYVLKFKVHIL
jgi:hypothetical protein